MIPYTNTEYRFERKFLIDSLDVNQVIRVLNMHPSFFVERYPARHVNNIYFDTANLLSYNDNLEGVFERFKIRLRWYGDLWNPDKSPKIEVKRKKGLAGFKDSFDVPLQLSGECPTNLELKSAIGEANIPKTLIDKLHNFSPSLINRYNRRYFVSYDNRFRVTVDKDLQFYAGSSFLSPFMQESVKLNKVIVELKLHSSEISNGSEISSILPFRMTKSSKYVLGLSKLMQSTIRL